MNCGCVHFSNLSRVPKMAFQISLKATTEVQRSKLAQWAETRTKTNTILRGEHTTIFSGVFLEPHDAQKIAVTMARNVKN